MDIARIGLSCGRLYLEVSSIIVAMEGDVCRDSTIPEKYRTPVIKIDGKPIELVRYFGGSAWNEEMLEYVRDKINLSVKGD